MPPKLRTCSQCKCELPETLENFKYDDHKGRRGWQSWCRACCSARCKAWNDAHKEGQKAKRAARHEADPFHRRLKDLRYQAKKQGVKIDLAQAEAAIRRFSGYCATCDTPIAGFTMCLDHCHTTGRVRGGICRGCNSGIGAAEESPRILTGLLTYLERTSHAG